jgi:DNA replication and repair protein RecF
VWLTPQMDGLFLDAASERRRFFDRLVYAFDPAHAGRVTRYESVMSQRSRLLKGQKEDGVAADPQWLSSLEATMAETGVAIAAARLQTLQSLAAHVSSILKDTGFPVSSLSLSGGIEEALQSSPALQVEDKMRDRLSTSRGYDADNGGASVGPHRTDLQVMYADRNMPAAQCSTGEQKALLTGIVLAHAVRTAEIRDAAPILLLDEVAAHLDAARRASLFGVLRDLKAQVFITGTDASVFADLTDVRHMSITGDLIREAA